MSHRMINIQSHLSLKQPPITEFQAQTDYSRTLLSFLKVLVMEITNGTEQQKSLCLFQKANARILEITVYNFSHTVFIFHERKV